MSLHINSTVLDGAGEVQAAGAADKEVQVGGCWSGVPVCEHSW